MDSIFTGTHLHGLNYYARVSITILFHYPCGWFGKMPGDTVNKNDQ